jgi:hypothetical protein
VPVWRRAYCTCLDSPGAMSQDLKSGNPSSPDNVLENQCPLEYIYHIQSLRRGLFRLCCPARFAAGSLRARAQSCAPAGCSGRSRAARPRSRPSAARGHRPPAKTRRSSCEASRPRARRPAPVQILTSQCPSIIYYVRNFLG